MKRLLILLFAASSLIAVGQVPEYVPTEGLVGWWAFEGNAQDQSGNDIDLLEVGSVEYVSDRLGNATSAIGFGGGATESRVQFPNFGLLDNWNQGTLSFWVNVVEHNVTGHYFGFDNMFSVRQRHGVNTQFMLGLFGGTTRVRIHLNGALPNSGDLVSEDALVVGQWHHVTMTFNSSEGFQHIYIDGQLSGSKASAAMISNMGAPDMLAFGFYGGVGSGSCNSFMDEIGLWNRALDALEVESLFATLVPVTGCVDTSACNFDVEATVDDGSCIPSGCMDAEACNYVAEAGCDDGSCDYTCCPGPGCCSVGHYWDWEVGKCFDINPGDINLDGCVQLNDLLDLLSAYGDCGAEETPWQCGDPLDYQGYNYETVQIGEQCWFAENLRAENYMDGSSISLHSIENPVSGPDPNYRCIYEDDVSNVAGNGMLYSWYASTDSRGICPSGWHLPSLTDFQDLTNAVGGAPNAGSVLKVQPPIWNGSDEYGFSALPSGYFNWINAPYGSDPVYFFLGSYAYFWSSVSSGSNSAYYMILRPNQDDAFLAPHNGNFAEDAMSIRCIKDTE